MEESQEIFDALIANHHKDDQALAPPRASDPGWAHGVMINGGRQKIKCNYCHKIILGGGISRLKQHLARERGNVTPCEEVPENIKVEMQQNLGVKVLKKLKAQKGLKGSTHSVSYLQDSYGQRSCKVSSKRGASWKRRVEVRDGGNFNLKKKDERHFRPIIVKSSLQASFPTQESADYVDIAVANFMFVTGIPFSASNSFYFQQMADAIAAAGPGYKMPSYNSLRETIVDSLFWSLSECTLKVADPLLNVLQLTDNEERPSIGYIYDAMQKAKEYAMVAFNNEESDYLPYLNIIDRIWVEELHSPLHAAGWYLNPSIFYKPGFSTSKVIQKGLLDCIETLEPNLTSQVLITSHIKSYEDAVGDFGRPVALRGRESLAPASWWSLYAADYPDLQRLAVRVLSQTCSVIRCERNWSMFERIHAKKRNRLEHQRLNDLIFVHCSLRLRERREASKGHRVRLVYDPTCVEALDADVCDWVRDPGSLQGEDVSWMDVAVLEEVTAESDRAQNIENTDDRCSDDASKIEGNN
ncbi:hypothetical protein RJ639_017194 [Escallonia herrerae]|uniref:BED-type domain-containing protein n=1 Tax=Escallonia herrerae TaxID=1293975 RepID=A0AA88VB70_9ASTE|nr:hypothetical protein RJ639_017194 [Escallonia herrerae]